MRSFNDLGDPPPCPPPAALGEEDFIDSLTVPAPHVSFVPSEGRRQSCLRARIQSTTASESSCSCSEVRLKAPVESRDAQSPTAKAARWVRGAPGLAVESTAAVESRPDPAAPGGASATATRPAAGSSLVCRRPRSAD